MGRKVANVLELLRSTNIVIAAETFVLVSLSLSEWKTLCATQNTFRQISGPHMVLADAFEVTLLLSETSFRAVAPAYLGGKIEGGFRLLTFDIALDFSVVGFMAEVSRILAEAGVSILPISAFSRDHLLIKQDQLATALEALGPHVGELC